MKYFATVLMLAAIGLVSCKKDYTCECTTTGGGSSISASSTVHATKKDAKDACNAGDESYTIGSDTYETKCEIK